MKLLEKYFLFNSCWVVLAMAFTIYSCESKPQNEPIPGNSDTLSVFPSFLTPVEKYFKTSISGPPAIDIDSYQLKISGAVNTPATFSLEELNKLEMIERTLTIECIGNPVNGDLVSNATWKGFRLYDLLSSLGIKEGASTVKYICADGYYTYNTMEELQNADVLGALYMNEEPIPEAHGFPLRIIFPGYYGVRQPGWIVEIELLESGPADYWTRSGWKSDTSMTIDSKIFFPANNTKFTLGDSVKIGGAAYGSRRISAVDISVDDGKTWIPTTIKQDLEEDYIWIFWEVILIPQSTGPLVVRSKATAWDGSVQPRVDNQYLDGTNAWPAVSISVE
jgi:DMSO/TMAO reductase YedYZ molybdopterin-dependent catalytic subunit